jgi:hypothetical protein
MESFMPETIITPATIPSPLVSIVVPVLNEEDNILAFYAAVAEVLAPLESRYRFDEHRRFPLRNPAFVRSRGDNPAHS